MRGINQLRHNALPFSVIAVVNPSNVRDVLRFYDFFCTLGCETLCINVEEREGLNRDSSVLDQRVVEGFWQQLFEAWARNPVIRIREFDRVLGWMHLVQSGSLSERTAKDYWPTVGYDGSVVVLSPEFMSVMGKELQRFVAGNVLIDPLEVIVKRAEGLPYVRDFAVGIQRCERECAYYSFCGGGQASNKYFETGTTNATETAFCRNSRIALVDAVIGQLAKPLPAQGGVAAV
jgi:uncharacterized protein